MATDAGMRTFLTRTPEKPVRPGTAGRVAAVLPQWAVAKGRAAATAAVSPMSRRELRRVAASGDIRLHLGCGFEHKPGWTNIDLVGASADIYWDLRRGIPFPRNSVNAIFHEHLLEHLPMTVGLRFTDECYRVLAPGGVLRVVVPDAGMLIRKYVAGDASMTEHAPTGLISVQSMFYDWGHVAMYDAETLSDLLKAAGFGDVEQREFGKSWLDDAPDSESRAAESLYIEGRK